MKLKLIRQNLNQALKNADDLIDNLNGDRTHCVCSSPIQYKSYIDSWIKFRIEKALEELK